MNRIQTEIEGIPATLWPTAETCSAAFTENGYPVAVPGTHPQTKRPTIQGYLFRKKNGEQWDRNGLLPKQLWDPERFRLQRREAWLQHVDQWRAQHGLSREQALSVLRDGTQPISMKSLFDWAEAPTFLLELTATM